MIRLAALIALIASPAAAHGNLPGGGGFASGFAHPFLATEHLLVLLALGCVIGRQGVRTALIGLLGGLGLGFVLALGPMQGVILTAALVLGGLISANLRVPDMAVSAGAMVVGLLVAADTDGVAGASALMAHAGAVVGVFAIVLNTMAFAEFGVARLNGVPLRVAGSWIAAAAVLILAFLARGAFDLA